MKSDSGKGRESTIITGQASQLERTLPDLQLNLIQKIRKAYQFYLKGRYYWNKRTGESIKKSVDFYNKAIEKDPNYATAHQWHGINLLLCLGRFDEAISELKKAKQLEPLSLIIGSDLGKYCVGRDATMKQSCS